MLHKLEVIAFNISCCREIEHAGAHRIELCANPHEGGTTPSAGFIVAARKVLTIHLFPIIRPRGGDFHYTPEEFSIMRDDVILCKKAGCDGIVTGILLDDGRVDKPRMTEITNLAYPMEVTFHRAFDRTPEPFEALEDIISTGCTRILTSGQQAVATDGRVLIHKLIEKAGSRIIIMPGSGIRSTNIKEIAASTGAVEFHSSAKQDSKNKMQSPVGNFARADLHTVVNAEEVTAMCSLLQSLDQV